MRGQKTMTETRPAQLRLQYKLNLCYSIVNIDPGKFKFKSLAQDLGQIMTILTKGAGDSSQDTRSGVKNFPIHCSLRHHYIAI